MSKEVMQKLEEHSVELGNIRGILAEHDATFHAIDHRFDRIDVRFDHMESLVDLLGQTMADHTNRFDQIEVRLDRIEETMVTKDDLLTMATKEDLLSMATKTDLESLNENMREMMQKLDQKLDRMSFFNERRDREVLRVVDRLDRAGIPA